MNISTKTLVQTPSFQQFLKVIEKDLSNRRSVLVLLPIGIDPLEIWSQLRANLWQRDYALEEIWLPDLPKDHTPVIALGDFLGIDWGVLNGTSSLAKLVATRGLVDIVQLDGLDQLSVTPRKNWMIFLTAWAQDSHSVANLGHLPVAMCAVVPAISILPEIPESDVYLATHWWWKVPSALEVQLLCRLGNEDNLWNAKTHWREHLLPALVGNDISLIEYLWESSHLGLEELIHKLCSFAKERDWEEESLQEWGATEFIVKSIYSEDYQMLSPPVRWQNLWAHGALSWTPEYGFEVHVAALAVLGRNEEVKHRLWRGQAKLLLPMIDHTRLTLCSYLTKRYGYDWPVRWHQPSSPDELVAVQSNPLACQWGYLEWLLRNCNHLRTERAWTRMATLAHWIRNEIAHYRPITFRDFEGFWHEIEQIYMLKSSSKLTPR